MGVTEFIFEISRIVFSVNFLKEMISSNLILTLNFSLNFERMCKLMKEEKRANKNWGVTELFQKLFRKKSCNL